MKLSKTILSLLVAGVALAAAACDYSHGAMKTTTGDAIGTPDDNTPPPPPPPPTKEVTVEGVDAGALKAMGGLWSATSFDKKNADGTSEDLLKVFDDTMYLSIDAGGNAHFTYTKQSGDKREDADQVQAVSAEALEFEKQGKAFAFKIEGDEMTFTGMPNNADDDDAVDDIVWIRVQVKLPVLPSLPKFTLTPVVEKTNPLDGKTFLGLIKTYVSYDVTFNQAIDQSTFGGIHFERDPGNGMIEYVAATVTAKSGSTYTVKTAMKFGKCKLVIPGGSSAKAVKNAGGTPLDKTYEVHFTSESWVKQNQNQNQI